MDEQLKRAFINQMSSLIISLDNYVREGFTSKQRVIDQYNQVKEIKKFATEYCEDEVKPAFENIPDLDLSIISKIHIFTILRFCIVGLFFNGLRLKYENALMNYFINSKKAIENTLQYYRLG